MTSPAVAPLDEEDPTAIGGYTLLGRLGDGGMGTVYLGRGSAGNLVAVKVIRREFARDPVFRTRFLREAQAARRVARFCTAEVLDVDADARQPYLVTEFVDGPPLSRVVEQRGPLPPLEVERLAVAVASALTAIHAAGLVHRDLRPGNILLSSSGARVIDFGIARALDSGTRLTGQYGIGTPAFMAPEQALGEEATQAADIYAWGGVVLYAATGRPPGGVGPAPAVLYRVVHSEPDLTGLDRALRPLVEAAMRKDPAARPTAQELLMRLMKGRSPAALPPSTGGLPVRVPTGLPAPTGPLPLTGPSTGGLPARSAGPVEPVEPAESAEPPDGDPVRSGRRPAEPAPAGAGQAGAGKTGAGQAGSPAAAARPARRRLSPPLVLGGVILAVCSLVATLLFVFRDPAGQDSASPAAGQGSAALLDGQSGVTAAAFAPDGRTLVTGGGDQAGLWDVTASTGPVLHGPLPGHSGGLSTVAFAPDGRLLATGAADGTVRLWEPRPAPDGPRAVGEPIAAVASTVRSLAFSPQGRLLAVGGADGAMRLFDLTDPALPRAVVGMPVAGATTVRSLAFSPTRDLLAVGGADGTVRLWDLTDPASPQPAGESTPSSASVRSITFSADGRLLAAGSVTGMGRLWDLGPGEPGQVPAPDQSAAWPVGRTLEGHTGEVLALAFSPDNRTLATGSADDRVRLWDLGDPGGAAAGQPRSATAPLEIHSGDVLAVSFAQNGQTLVAATADGTVRHWNLA